MGTWNAKPFGNDTAGDWLWELEKATDESVLRAALGAGAEGEETVAAAAVIEAARHQPLGKLPPEAKRWVSERGFVPGDALVKQAMAAVEKIRDHSELRECWTESKSLSKWLEQVELLLAGLREGLSKPPPVRKPKAPAPPRSLDELIETVNPDEPSPLREKLRQKLELLDDVNAPIAGTVGKTALNLVAAQGLIPEARRLVERGARINPALENPLFSLTPLEEACANGRAEMAEWLLAQGAQIYVERTFAGFERRIKVVSKVVAVPWTLFKAVRSGSIATIEVLVRHGARLISKDLEKELGRYQIALQPLIHMAVEAGHPEVIEFLAKNGVNLEAKDNLGFTPLLLAANLASRHDRKNVIEKLLSLGANPNTRDNDGNTALDLVSDGSDKEIVKLLKKHGGGYG